MKGYHMASCNSAINQRFLKGAIVSADPENICPGCGAEIRTIEGKGTDYETIIYACGTGEESGYYGRQCWANQCMAKEEELAQQTELLRRAGEVVKGLLIMGDTVKPRKLDEALTWRENDYRIKTQAQALLPDIEKALEVVK